MSYLEFEKLAIKARWYYAEMRDYNKDYGKEISDLLTLLCHGERDMSYSLLVLWTSKPNSFVYYWSVLCTNGRGSDNRSRESDVDFLK